MDKLKLRRHETFSLRDGWVQKGIDAVENHGNETFHKEKGIRILGIGSNMVKSLKYWMTAGNVIESQPLKVELSEFGLALSKYDRYLETDFSWCFYHYFLASNFQESPVIYYIYNIYGKKVFEKEQLIEDIDKYLTNNGYDVNKDSVLEDVSMCIRMYMKQKIDNPEDNLVSPLAALGLLEQGYTSYDFNKTMVDIDMLDYRIVYYALQKIYNNSFEFNAALVDEKSPVKIFNLNKGVFAQYINTMKNHGLVTVNKTAGLNTIYFNKLLSLDDLFANYFGGR